MRNALVLLILLSLLLVSPGYADRDKVGSYISAADIFNTSGHYYAGATMLEKAIFFEDNRTDLLYDQARSYALAKKYTDAIASLQRAADIDNRATAYTMMAYYAEKGLNNSTLREKYLTSAMKADVQNPADAYMLASAQYALRDLNGSRETLKTAVANYPNSGELWDLKGEYDWIAGDYDESLISYEHAIDRAETTKEKLHSLWRKALVLTTSGKGTIFDLEKIQNISEGIQPGSAVPIQLFTAAMNTRYGNFQNATREFDQIREEEDADTGYLPLFMADYAYKTGDLKNAYKQYEKLVKEYNPAEFKDLFTSPDAEYIRNQAEFGMVKILTDKKEGREAYTYAVDLAGRYPQSPDYQDALDRAKNMSADQYFSET